MADEETPMGEELNRAVELLIDRFAELSIRYALVGGVEVGNEPRERSRRYDGGGTAPSGMSYFPGGITSRILVSSQTVRGSLASATADHSRRIRSRLMSSLLAMRSVLISP